MRYITVQLLSALAYAHDQDVVHMDIKPANIFLTLSGDVKIGDWGAVRLKKLIKKGLKVICTPWYAAPEVTKEHQGWKDEEMPIYRARKKETKYGPKASFKPGLYGTKADIWSVGAILFELLGFKIESKS